MASNLNVNPLISTDTIHKNGRQIVLTTFHNCITALQQYENKSLEELRHEDYLLGRKYPMNPPVFRSSQVMTANSRSSQNGSYQVKYKSSPGADIKTVENGSFIHFDTFYTSITVMPEYEDKSFEEIRVEDYINGNKYPLVLPVSSNSNHYKTVEPIPIKSEIKNVDKNDDILIDSVCPICLESITTVIFYFYLNSLIFKFYFVKLVKNE